MLVAENVSFEVKGKRIIEDISMSVEQGEIFSILGPNGAGKSTLLKCLSGFLKTTTGTITMDGRSVNRMTLEELALRRAVLTQNITLEFPFSAYEVVSMGRSIRHASEIQSNDEDIIQDALRRTSTASLKDRLFSTLSGGEQQRVHLARVIAQVLDQENALLLLDEPTSALDLKHQFMLFDICRDLCQNKRFSVITVLHDLRLAKAVSDRSLFLDKGCVFAKGESDETISTEIISSLYDLEPHQADMW